jgi:hypothetical protein
MLTAEVVAKPGGLHLVLAACEHHDKSISTSTRLAVAAVTPASVYKGAKLEAGGVLRYLQDELQAKLGNRQQEC